jgi:hypothetical protein
MAGPGSTTWLIKQLSEKNKLSENRLKKLAVYGKHAERACFYILDDWGEGCENAAALLGVMKLKSSLPKMLELYAHSDPEYMLHNYLHFALKNYGAELVESTFSREWNQEEREMLLGVLVSAGVKDERIRVWLEEMLRTIGEDEVGLYAGYCEEYGDPSFLPLLSERLDEFEAPDYIEDGFDTIEFNSVVEAIELLGGSLTPQQHAVKEAYQHAWEEWRERVAAKR